MTWIQSTTYSLATLTLLAASSSAFAIQCDDLYPVDPGTDYYSLDEPALDNETTQKIKDFARQVNGRWVGSGLEIDCGISNGITHPTITSFDIDAEITQHWLGAIILRAEKENEDKLALERVYVSPEIEKERQGREKGYRSYSVNFSSPNTIVFNEKYRVNNVISPDPAVLSALPVGQGFQRLIHEIKTVTLENNKLTMNRDLYVNGHFVSQQEWLLNKSF